MTKNTLLKFLLYGVLAISAHAIASEPEVESESPADSHTEAHGSNDMDVASSSKDEDSNTLAEQTVAEAEAEAIETSAEPASNSEAELSQIDKVKITRNKKRAKKICRSIAPTGSRISKKTCMTQEGWDEIARKAQTALDSRTRPSGNSDKDH